MDPKGHEVLGSAPASLWLLSQGDPESTWGLCSSLIPGP